MLFLSTHLLSTLFCMFIIIIFYGQVSYSEILSVNFLLELIVNNIAKTKLIR